MWLIWGIGAVVLVGSGYAAVAVPRLRERALQRRVAWSTAHAAITAASISRDAAGAGAPRDAEATGLLRRAETIAAARGGPDAAREATDLAETADRMWRE
ncbi:MULTISPECIES: DUF6403 family protein [Actinoplanes]|uniref:DUF6403 family protein n=1 Tax=Actinoplanes TaxID=1865 RepID=UPI0005F2A636|nr:MULTISPECIES: DUF6403 family protein [Actinoplanes]GLY07991.1 hypothetical protein Acsp01_83700 [Actinoplanes sp. NBRC 101535]